MSKYYPPTFKASHFHCALCHVHAKQTWAGLEYQGTTTKSPFMVSECDHCNKMSFWYQDRMIVPAEAPVPSHHEDLPASCVDNYNEARDICARSPKAAAALMRLVVQKLMIELGQSGRNLNDDIGSLVKAGLPVEVQKALDYCRVIGNNAVHPGEINIDDDPSVTYSLFEMVNFVVEDRITRPRKVSDLYKKLPDGALKAIQARDSEKGPTT
jgi:uncharacterized protein DUF4145